MKFNVFAVLALLYICVIVTAVSCSVGEMPKNTGPYQADLPLVMLGFLAIPLVLGYLAGRGD